MAWFYVGTDFFVFCNLDNFDDFVAKSCSRVIGGGGCRECTCSFIEVE